MKTLHSWRMPSNGTMLPDSLIWELRLILVPQSHKMSLRMTRVTLHLQGMSHIVIVARKAMYLGYKVMSKCFLSGLLSMEITNLLLLLVSYGQTLAQEMNSEMSRSSEQNQQRLLHCKETNPQSLVSCSEGQLKIIFLQIAWARSAIWRVQLAVWIRTHIMTTLTGSFLVNRVNPMVI